MAKRARLGKTRRAREGKVIAAGSPPFGFRFNEDRTNFVVCEAEMGTVRRVFRMVGLKGYSLRAVKKALERDQIPTPKGGGCWNRPVLRDMLLNDLYRPHSHAELEGLIGEGLLRPDVLARLDREERYGVWF